MDNKNKKEHKFANKIAKMFHAFGTEHEERLEAIKLGALLVPATGFMLSVFLNSGLVPLLIFLGIFGAMGISAILEALTSYGAKACDNIADKILEKCEISDQLETYNEMVLDKIDEQNKEFDRADITYLSAELAADENMIGEKAFNKAKADRTQAKQMLRDMLTLYKKHRKSIKKGELVSFELKNGKIATAEEKMQAMVGEYNFD